MRRLAIAILTEFRCFRRVGAPLLTRKVFTAEFGLRC